MISRITTWYKALTPAKKVLIALVSNWIYWFVAWLFIHKWINPTDDEPISYYLFFATFMSIFMTVPGQWRNIKAIFKKNKQQNQS